MTRCRLHNPSQSPDHWASCGQSSDVSEQRPMQNCTLRLAYSLLALFYQINFLDAFVFVFLASDQLAVDVLSLARSHVALFWYVVIDRMLLHGHQDGRCWRLLQSMVHCHLSLVMQQHRMVHGLVVFAWNLHCGWRGGRRGRSQGWRR